MTGRKPTYLPLAPRLYGEGPHSDPGALKPVIVECYQCTMTMFALSKNAYFEVATDRIICRYCADLPEVPQEK